MIDNEKATRQYSSHSDGAPGATAVVAACVVVVVVSLILVATLIVKETRQPKRRN